MANYALIPGPDHSYAVPDEFRTRRLQKAIFTG